MILSIFKCVSTGSLCILLPCTKDLDICFLIIELSFLYILDTNPLSDIWFVYVFSCSIELSLLVISLFLNNFTGYFLCCIEVFSLIEFSFVSTCAFYVILTKSLPKSGALANRHVRPVKSFGLALLRPLQLGHEAQ